VSIRRDYKPASTWQRRRQAVRRHGLLVITLVLIGLFGGLLAYINKKGGQEPAATATATTTVPARPSGAPAAPATPKPSAEIVPAPVKPKYDFYTELPKRQIDIRREEPRPHSVPAQPPARPQPAADPLRKPAAPKKNPSAPAVATSTPAGSKPAAPIRNLTRPAVTTASGSKPSNPSHNATTPTVTANGSKPVKSSGPASLSRPTQPPQSSTNSAIVVKTE
jgi:hypothetical protein